MVSLGEMVQVVSVITAEWFTTAAAAAAVIAIIAIIAITYVPSARLSTNLTTAIRVTETMELVTDIMVGWFIVATIMVWHSYEVNAGMVIKLRFLTTFAMLMAIIILHLLAAFQLLTTTPSCSCWTSAQ